ncbi:MAG TPA: hypothetical protein VFN67_38920 [Polyangiales bacterium]|nr:hypothetical protein [Polyangiales bacterium]
MLLRSDAKSAALGGPEIRAAHTRLLTCARKLIADHYPAYAQAFAELCR